MNTFYDINILANISLGISIVFFFFSLIQLIQPQRITSNYYLAIIYFAMAIQCLSFWFYYRSSPHFERFFYYSDSAFLFLIGPFLYLFFSFIAGNQFHSKKKAFLHSLPFIITLVVIEAINFTIPSLKIKKALPVIDYINTLSYLILLIYLVLILKTLNREKKEGLHLREIKTLRFIIICSIAFSFPLILSGFLWKDLLYMSHIAFFFISLLFIFFLIRFPKYFTNIHKQLQEIKYANSQLKGMDLSATTENLNYLMDIKKTYRDAELTLKKLSDQLKLSPPQLSELLNSQYGSNFNNFINRFRIEEIKAALKEETETSILEIAFRYGFNSKTAFYTVFKKTMGLTPSQYRKENQCVNLKK